MLWNTRINGLKVTLPFDWHPRSWRRRGMAITMVISLIFLLLLRFIASALVWLIIGGIVGAVGYGVFRAPLSNRFAKLILSFRLLSQVSATAIGSTKSSSGRRARTSPSLSWASIRTFMSTWSSDRRGSFSVRFNDPVGSLRDCRREKKAKNNKTKSTCGFVLKWLCYLWSRASFYLSWFSWGSGCWSPLRCWRKRASRYRRSSFWPLSRWTGAIAG